MIRRCLRFGIRLGLLGAVVMAILRFVKGRRSSPDWGHEAEPFTDVGAAVSTRPSAPETRPQTETPAEGAAKWVEPSDGACPATHPIKGKLKSNLYHLPGMVAYDRTVPDRCYADEAAAQADGLTRAKR